MNTSSWNKGRIVGQKRPLQISHIWGIRIRLELEGKTRDLALFNMALDSKLRGCDLVKLKVSDVAYGSSVSSRATVLQQKTGSPVQFEITKGTREAVTALIKLGNLHSNDFLFRSRVGTNQHISTRQYNRIFHGWIAKLGLDDSLYSTHSMRRTKPYLIYKKTKNLSFNEFVTCTILQNRVFCNQTGEDEYGEFESGYSGRRTRHAYAAGHKGNSKGDAADR